jgi:hypothetical protein
VLRAHDLGYSLVPGPETTLKCDDCRHVLLIVDEQGRPFVEVWLIDQGQDEAFREFVDRTARGEGGPLGGDIL